MVHGASYGSRTLNRNQISKGVSGPAAKTSATVFGNQPAVEILVAMSPPPVLSKVFRPSVTRLSSFQLWPPSVGGVPGINRSLKRTPVKSSSLAAMNSMPEQSRSGLVPRETRNSTSLFVSRSLSRKASTRSVKSVFGLALSSAHSIAVTMFACSGLTCRVVGAGNVRRGRLWLRHHTSGNRLVAGRER